MQPIKRILVATDFSEIAERALDYAIDLARTLHAAIVIVHTYELPMYGFPDGTVMATADVAARIASAAQSGLKAVADKRRGAEVEITTLLRTGPTAAEINAAAEEIGADLVVVGTHGRRGLSRALLGSVADRIIRTANRPVLVIGEPSAHAAK